MEYVLNSSPHKTYLKQ